MELVHHRQIKETCTVTVEEARELIAKEMVNEYFWRIQSPSSVVPDDMARYDRDCKAVGVENCFA